MGFDPPLYHFIHFEAKHQTLNSASVIENMGRPSQKEQLVRTLASHLNTIHETFQLLDQAATSSLDKVSWDEVGKMGEQVSKQAIVAGMLWTEEMPEVKSLEENMATYFNSLQGFVLLSHGSMAGAGPTLSSSIHASVKQVVDCSFMLWKEAVSSYGSRNKGKKLSIPQLVGKIMEACSALKKTPSTDVMAIGRAMTRVAVSIKDVLRETKDLKPGPADPTNEESGEASNISENGLQDTDSSSDIDLGNDLSPEEMKIAELATGVVSETLVVVKELIRIITDLAKREKAEDCSNFVGSLEKLLRLCQEMGAQIDELGAGLYPPQELSVIKAVLDKILGDTDEMQVEVESLGAPLGAFLQVCSGLKNSLRQLECWIGNFASPDLISKIQALDVSK